MIFVDSHVHIYDCFAVDDLFDSALKNFRAAAEQHATGQLVSFVLLLTEGATEDWFHNVPANIDQDGPASKKISAGWSGFFSNEKDSLTVYRNGSPEEKMHLVCGRQVVTSEKIEVLALYCSDTIMYGLSLDETVDSIEKHGGIPVLPWGVGKWIGKRGKIIQQYLSDHQGKPLFLGDNGGRPQFWPTPALFHFARKRGFPVLPGTDPLPIPAEAARVGSYGFYLDDRMAQDDSPVSCLKNALLSGKESFSSFGRLQNTSLFVFNQLRLRFSS